MNLLQYIHTYISNKRYKWYILFLFIFHLYRLLELTSHWLLSCTNHMNKKNDNHTIVHIKKFIFQYKVSLLVSCKHHHRLLRDRNTSKKTVLLPATPGYIITPNNRGWPGQRQLCDSPVRALKVNCHKSEDF